MTGARVTWVAQSSDEGEACFRIGTSGTDVIAEWPGLAKLVAARDGSTSELTFEHGVDPRDADKIRRGSAWLLLRHLEGRLGLHGSAVSVGEDCAIVFLGRSGDGKSTLAAAMCGSGCSLLADDAVALEEAAGGAWHVVPHEVDHWLDAEARRALGAPPSDRAKAPWRARRSAEAAVPVAAFVELAFDDAAPRLSLQRGSRAVQSLIPQVARFVLDEPERQRRELDMLHTIVETTPVYLLERPRRFSELERTVDLLLDLVASRTDEGMLPACPRRSPSSSPR